MLRKCLVKSFSLRYCLYIAFTWQTLGYVEVECILSMYIHFLVGSLTSNNLATGCLHCVSGAVVFQILNVFKLVHHLE